MGVSFQKRKVTSIQWIRYYLNEKYSLFLLHVPTHSQRWRPHVKSNVSAIVDYPPLHRYVRTPLFVCPAVQLSWCINEKWIEDCLGASDVKVHCVSIKFHKLRRQTYLSLRQNSALVNVRIVIMEQLHSLHVTCFTFLNSARRWKRQVWPYPKEKCC